MGKKQYPRLEYYKKKLEDVPKMLKQNKTFHVMQEN